MRKAQEILNSIQELRVQVIMLKEAVAKVLRVFESDRAAITAMKEEIGFLRTLVTQGFGPTQMPLIEHIPIPDFDDSTAGEVIHQGVRNSNEPKGIEE